jgi:adenosylcobyric acid synthase
MHVGKSEGAALQRPFLDLAGRPEGALSACGRIIGCYVHGLFAADDFRHHFLRRLRSTRTEGISYGATVEMTLDLLADHLERHLDITSLGRVAGL